MLNQVVTFGEALRKQFFETSIGISTVFVIIAIYLKLNLNQSKTALNRKRMIISTPPEITFLGIGFLTSQIAKAEENIYSQLLAIGIALFILMVQYTVVQSLENNISGSPSGKTKAVIAGMYGASIILYLCVVVGGA